MKLNSLIILTVGLLQSVVLAAPAVKPSVPGAKGRLNVVRGTNDAVRTQEGKPNTQNLNGVPRVTNNVIPFPVPGNEAEAMNTFDVKLTVEEAVEFMRRAAQCKSDLELCRLVESLARKSEAAVLREAGEAQISLESHATILNLSRGVHNVIVRFEPKARDNYIFVLKEFAEGMAKGQSATLALNIAIQKLMVEKFKIPEPTPDEVIDQRGEISLNCA